MLCRTVFILLLFLFCGHLHSQTTDRRQAPFFLVNEISAISKDSFNQKANRLCLIWDSLYPAKKNIVFNLLTEQQWKLLFEKEYAFAVKNKDEQLQFRLAYPLAVISHVTTEFSIALPLFQFLYKNKTKLSRQKYSLVLIKLEEVYRSMNRMQEAMRIRSERIQQGFIATFWELYAECGLWDEAVNDYLTFEKLPAETSVQRMKYFWFLGDLFFNAGRTDSAEKYYSTGMDEAVRFIKASTGKEEYSTENLQFWLGNFKGLLGRCYWKKQLYTKAVDYFLSDLTTCSGRYRMRSWAYLADCNIKLNKLQECKTYLDSLEVYLRGRTVKEFQLLYLKSFAGYYKGLGRPDSAYHYLVKYNDAKEAINKNVEENQAAYLVVKVEMQKRRSDLLHAQQDLVFATTQSRIRKQQLIILAVLFVAAVIIIGMTVRNNRLHKAANNKIEQQHIRLQKKSIKIAQQNERNQLLLRELHHRVKNNLQVVCSLMNIQKRRIDNTEMQELISSIQSRVQSMSFVHEHLCNTDKVEMVDMHEYVQELLHYLQNLHQKNNVAIECQLEPFQLNIDKAVSLGIILNEVITNALKYAFNETERGILKMKMQQVNGYCEMLVADNGPGIDQQQVRKNGIGTKLITTMCKQLDAEYNKVEKNGVSHFVKFKI